MPNDTLIAELNRHLGEQLSQATALRRDIEGLRHSLAERLDDLERAFRLFHSLTGSSHPDEFGAASSSSSASSRPQPRVDQVLRVLDRKRAPVSLDVVVDAMPDAPERGAVSAALHRAIKQGAVNRVARGVYEIAATNSKGRVRVSQSAGTP